MPFTTVQMTSFLPAFEIRTLALAVMGLAGGLLSLFSMASDARNDVADMDLAELANVRVSRFEVSTYLDSAYRASNSISGSRLDTPIRKLPFAVQAFTDQSYCPSRSTRSRPREFLLTFTASL